MYARGESYRYNGLKKHIQQALVRIDEVVSEMKKLKGTYPIGQWNWLEDAETALSYKKKIEKGWIEYGNVKLDNE